MKAPSTTASDFDSGRPGSASGHQITSSFSDYDFAPEVSAPTYTPLKQLISALAFVVAGALLLAPSAFGASKYVAVGQFPPAYPANQTWTPTGFNSTFAESVAINNHNGHIYVADSGRSAIYDFESTTDSTPSRWNGANTPSGSFGGAHVSVAVDNTTGDLYVADRGHAVIDKFDEDGNLITSFGDTSPSPNGQLAGLTTPDGSFSPAQTAFSPFGIAVNQVTHDLYVIDARHEVIDVFSEDGVYLRQITATPIGMYREGGDYTVAIAVNSTTGSVYVGDWAGPNLLFEFDSAGNYVKTWDGSNTPDGNFSGGCTGCYLISVAVEESTGNVFVGSSGNRAIDIFDESGDFLSPQIVRADYVGSTDVPYALGYVAGIAIDQETGYLYVSNGDHVEIYRPVIVPDVAIEPVSGVTAKTATLTGHVDPAGGTDITTCRFEYISDFKFRQNPGEDPWVGAKEAECGTAPPSSLPYGDPTDVAATVSGLQPGAPYHVRLIAGSAQGQNRAVGPIFATEGEFAFSKTLGSPGTGDGQLNGPQDVALDSSTGAIYVADTENHRVVKYDEAGNFVETWGWGVADGSAVSQVCSSGCQAGIAGSGPGQFDSPRYIEVDNSSGPSSHDVYVADAADDVVQKFTESGQLVSSWGDEGGSDFSKTGAIVGMTVSKIGDLFVVGSADPYFWTRVGQDGVSASKQETGGFWGLGVPNGGGIEIDNAGGYYETQENGGVLFKNPTQYLYEGHSVYPNSYSGIRNTGMALDRATGDLYVAQETYIDQFALSIPLGCASGAGGGIAGSSTCGPQDTFGYGHLVAASGLGFDSMRGRLYAADPGAERIVVFARAPMPSVTTGPATDITATSGTLTGHVDPPPGGDVAACHFDYGTDTRYELGSLPCSPAGSMSEASDVTTTLSDLSPLVTYHYRLVAEGSNELPRIGQDRSFTASDGFAPTVLKSNASAVSPTSATLEAQINPRSAPTSYQFQYGPTAAYGQQTASSVSIGNDDSAHDVSAAIGGLQSGVTYHFRVVTINFNGTSASEDQTFSTPAAPTIFDSGVSSVTRSTAILTARITAGFRPTTFQFEYGPTTGYGALASGDAGSDNELHVLASPVSGLRPGTTYHFRVTATNSISSRVSSDQTFTTGADEAKVPPKPRCKRGLVHRNGKCVKKRRRRAGTHKHKQKHRANVRHRRGHGHA